MEFTGQPLDLVALFGREAPLVLEIGFGMGASLVEMAKSCPEKNFIGIEVHRPGVGACLSAAAAEGVTNLRVFCHDAVEVLEQMIPVQSVDTLQFVLPGSVAQVASSQAPYRATGVRADATSVPAHRWPVPHGY